MRKQVLVLVTVALVIGAAGLAVQAADTNARRGGPVALTEEQVANARSASTETPTPVGWPVRYDTFSPAFYITWTGTYAVGNVFDTNSGAPLLTTGSISAVSWLGRWDVTNTAAPALYAYLALKPLAGPVTAVSGSSLLFGFPAPAPQAAFYYQGAVFPSPVPIAPAWGPAGFGAAIVNNGPVSGGVNWQIFENTSAGAYGRVVATTGGYINLGYHGRSWTRNGGTYAYTFGSWLGAPGNAQVRLYGNLLTPIELLSLEAE